MSYEYANSYRVGVVGEFDPRLGVDREFWADAAPRAREDPRDELTRLIRLRVAMRRRGTRVLRWVYDRIEVLQRQLAWHRYVGGRRVR